MSFADRGSVSDIDPAFFIGYLHRQKATGTLKFEDAPTQRAVYFRDGRILFSSSNAPEDQMGAILVAAGKIGQEQFAAVIASLEPKQSIAAALAQEGHVSHRDIGDAARRKVEQIVGACCVQTTGRYEFQDGVLPRGSLDLKLTTEKVLISAFAALEPSGFLIRILKSPMAVLAPGEAEPTDPDLIPLREALDGFSSLADVGGKVGLSPAATEVRAAVLVVLGAASVVTSQIEEMALPETGEDEPGAPDDIGLQADPTEAESFVTDASSTDGGAPHGSDATLVMSPSADGAFQPSANETLVIQESLGLLFPRRADESGAMRAGVPKRERATTDDLAAVKELLGSSTRAASSSESPSSSSNRTEEMLSAVVAAGRSGRSGRGTQAFFKNPAFRGVAAAVLFGVVLFAGWVAYTKQQAGPSALPSASIPGPSPAASATAAAGLETPPAAAREPAADAIDRSPAPVASAFATPPPPAAQNPSPATTAQPLPVQTNPPANVAAVVPPDGPGAGAAYEMLKTGRLADAAAAFQGVAQLRRAEFSVQILVACSPQTIPKAIQNDPSPDLFILPTIFSGKPCHRLMRGFWKTEEEATRAVSALPAYYTQEGARPRVVAVQAALR